MTTFTGPLHVKASADDPGVDLTGFRGTLSLVSAGGTSTVVLTTAGNPVVFGTISSAGGSVLARGFVKIIVEGTVAQVPFFYSTT